MEGRKAHLEVQGRSYASLSIGSAGSPVPESMPLSVLDSTGDERKAFQRVRVNVVAARVHDTIANLVIGRSDTLLSPSVIKRRRTPNIFAASDTSIRGRFRCPKVPLSITYGTGTWYRSLNPDNAPRGWVRTGRRL